MNEPILSIKPDAMKIYEISKSIHDEIISLTNRNRPLTSTIQNKAIRVFRYIGLKIKISSNLEIVNFFRDISIWMTIRKKF